MNKIYFMGVAALLLAGCTGNPNPAPLPSAAPNTSATLTEIVDKSACRAVLWKDRGHAPLGYLRGVARAYQRNLCRYRSPLDTVAGVIGREAGDITHDALVHYGLVQSGTSAEERLTISWTLLIGLGMRESSGKWCEGRDMSADNTSSETAEAGPFQASWNSRAAHPRLVPLMSWYKANPESCDLPLWKEGVDIGAKSCRPNFGGRPSRLV